MMRIVQLANFYGPSTGGLRTAVDALGAGYQAAGHERILVVPGTGYSCTRRAGHGLRITLPSLPVPAGYRLIVRRGPLLRLLHRLAPDSIEVSDRLTLTHTADWARTRGIRAVLYAHERLDAILAARVPAAIPLPRLADGWNRPLAAAFDAVVTASAFAAEEFTRIDAPNLHRVPLGVDLDLFSPAAARHSAAPAGDGRAVVRLVCTGRLSAEKRPGLAVDTVRILHDRGLPVRLDMVGDGPERHALERRAHGLPVTFHGHLADRRAVAAVIARADLALAPCPAETFALAVLEALACGTPVVATTGGAAQELLTPGTGTTAPATPAALADAVLRLLGRPRERSRASARARAEVFPWSRSVARILDVHAPGTPLPAGPGIPSVR